MVFLDIIFMDNVSPKTPSIYSWGRPKQSPLPHVVVVINA